jgi:hypothetical protein
LIDVRKHSLSKPNFSNFPNSEAPASDNRCSSFPIGRQNRTILADPIARNAPSATRFTPARFSDPRFYRMVNYFTSDFFGKWHFYCVG